MTHYDQFVGLDVGKFSIAVDMNGDHGPFEVTNDQAGTQDLIACLEQAGLAKEKTLLVLGPTGGYETSPWVILPKNRWVYK